MRRTFIAALMAAVSFVPVMATAQERGDRGDRGAGRAERMQQRQDGGNAGMRQQRQPDGGARNWQQRQPQQAQAQSGGWQQRPGRADGDQRQRPQPAAGGWQQQPGASDRPARSGGWNRPQGAQVQQRWSADRRDDRAGDRVGRGNDRQPFVNGQRADPQRNWARSGADWNDQRRWDNGRQYRQDQRGWNGGRNDRGGGWNRDWRRDSRYDWNGWRANNRNAFRLPRYYAPNGWNAGYRNFGIGAVLQSVLFSQNYWINDPWSYRLPDVDGSFRWVRYYNDALLVDVYSGQVVDVVNGIFW